MTTAHDLAYGLKRTLEGFASPQALETSAVALHQALSRPGTLMDATLWQSYQNLIDEAMEKAYAERQERLKNTFLT